MFMGVSVFHDQKIPSTYGFDDPAEGSSREKENNLHTYSVK